MSWKLYQCACFSSFLLCKEELLYQEGNLGKLKLLSSFPCAVFEQREEERKASRIYVAPGSMLLLNDIYHNFTNFMELGLLSSLTLELRQCYYLVKIPDCSQKELFQGTWRKEFYNRLYFPSLLFAERPLLKIAYVTVDQSKAPS